jgi:dTDP-4-dehydrorhamnose reductase
MSKSQPKIRIAVTGTQGQVVNALHERAHRLGVEIIPVGRPKLDLTHPDFILSALAGAKPAAIVNAASYNAVDQAEDEPLLAHQINAEGARLVAAAAHILSVPVIQLSTDYVFDGKKMLPYVETDTVHPLNVYGMSKAAGEAAVAERTANCVILRLSWVYSPFGKNFVRTILRVAGERQALQIVDDQHGAPTSAFDIADGIVAVIKNLITRPDDAELRGIFHMVAGGETTWAKFGSAVFAISQQLGGPFAQVRPIASKDYPHKAERPANSRLDCTKIATIHGVQLPDWRSSLKLCVERIIQTNKGSGATK